MTLQNPVKMRGFIFIHRLCTCQDPLRCYDTSVNVYKTMIESENQCINGEKTRAILASCQRKTDRH